MNIKTIHFLFIVVSALVAFLFAGWEIANYRALPSSDALVGGICGALAGVGLVIYSVVFLKKTRKLIL